MKPALLFALFLSPAAVLAGDLQIKVQKRQANSPQSQPSGNGLTLKVKESFLYEVTVTNSAFKPSPELQARYVIFIDRQDLGSKQGTEKEDRITGDAPVGALAPHGNTSFRTKPVQLKEQSLTGGWIYSNGGRIKAKDSLAGVWIKLFEGEKEVAEYANPSTLTSRHQWAEVSVAKAGKKQH